MLAPTGDAVGDIDDDDGSEDAKREVDSDGDGDGDKNAEAPAMKPEPTQVQPSDLVESALVAPEASSASAPPEVTQPPAVKDPAAQEEPQDEVAQPTSQQEGRPRSDARPVVEPTPDWLLALGICGVGYLGVLVGALTVGNPILGPLGAVLICGSTSTSAYVLDSPEERVQGATAATLGVALAGGLGATVFWGWYLGLAAANGSLFRFSGFDASILAVGGVVSGGLGMIIAGPAFGAGAVFISKSMETKEEDLSSAGRDEIRPR